MKEESTWAARINARHSYFTEENAEDFFSGWRHTGQFRDHGAPTAICGLCGNTGLRYHFLVAHRETGEALWVGSQCVLNFDLGEDAAQRKVRQARQRVADEFAEIDEAQLIEMLAQLQGIYQKANREEQRRIRWMVGKFQRRGGFSAGDLGWLFQAMLAAGIKLDPNLFPLILKTKQDKQEIGQLSLSALGWLSPALTAEQVEICRKLGVRLELGPKTP